MSEMTSAEAWAEFERHLSRFGNYDSDEDDMRGAAKAFADLCVREALAKKDARIVELEETLRHPKLPPAFTHTALYGAGHECNDCRR